jgi:serine/threonine protein kinase/Tfp pilus assembly protein PilF
MFQESDPDKPLGGRYKVISQLAAGGFGQTFLAHDLHLPGQPRCVVKQLKPQVSDVESLQTARRLFDTEAQVLYNLGSHDQIPGLLAHFEDNQEFYLAQQLIEGHPLTEELAPGQPWPEAQVIALLQDILNVLSFVHQQQVIHRDIKPSNLIRRQRDGRIVLIDFGAVKQVSTQMVNPKTGRTNMTISIGTHGYMPKEQLLGSPRFSSDIYAVGMIGIQALTGVHPRLLPEDANTGEVVWHERIQHVSAEFVAILDKMVRYEFRARYISAVDALQALRSLPPELLASVPSLQSLPNTPQGLPNPALQAPPTATGATVPMMGVAPNNTPATAPPPQSSSGHSTPTIATGSDPLPQPSATSPASGHSTPTVTTGSDPLPQPSATSPASGHSTPTVATGSTPLPQSSAPSPVSGHSTPTVATGSTPLSQPSAPSPASGHSTPTVATGPDQLSQPAAVSRPTVSAPGSPQKSPIKPLPIIGGVVALGASVWVVKGLLSPQSTPQTASKGNTISALSSGATGDPKQTADLLSQADRLREAENYQEAIATYEKAIAINPNEAKAHWGLCYSLNQMGKPTEAIAECDRALAINPNYAEALSSKGNSLHQQQNYEEELKLYDQALKINPEYVEAWNNRGVALLKLNRFDDAFAAFDKATQLNPKWPDAWANRGNALFALKRYDDAIASIQKALEIDPNHVNANNLLQQIRRQLGRYGDEPQKEKDKKPKEKGKK